MTPQLVSFTLVQPRGVVADVRVVLVRRQQDRSCSRHPQDVSGEIASPPGDAQLVFIQAMNDQPVAPHLPCQHCLDPIRPEFLRDQVGLKPQALEFPARVGSVRMDGAPLADAEFAGPPGLLPHRGSVGRSNTQILAAQGALAAVTVDYCHFELWEASRVNGYPATTPVVPLVNLRGRLVFSS